MWGRHLMISRSRRVTAYKICWRNFFLVSAASFPLGRSHVSTPVSGSVSAARATTDRTSILKLSLMWVSNLVTSDERPSTGVGGSTKSSKGFLRSSLTAYPCCVLGEEAPPLGGSSFLSSAVTTPGQFFVISLWGGGLKPFSQGSVVRSSDTSNPLRTSCICLRSPERASRAAKSASLCSGLREKASPSTIVLPAKLTSSDPLTTIS